MAQVVTRGRSYWFLPTMPRVIARATARGVVLGLPALVLVPVGIMLVAGCYSDRGDDGTPGPGADNDPFDYDTAQLVGTSALDIVTDFIEVVPDWVGGELGGIGGKRAPGHRPGSGGSTEPVFDEREKCWVFADSLVIGTYASMTRYSFSYKVQYKKNRTSQREHQGADEMWFWIGLVESGHWESDQPAQEAYSIDYLYRYYVNGSVTDLPDLPYTCQGRGLFEGNSTVVSYGGVATRCYGSTFTADVTLEPGGCPAGFVIIKLDPFVLTGNYHGTDAVTWTLDWGVRTVRSGSAAVSCGGGGG